MHLPQHVNVKTFLDTILFTIASSINFSDNPECSAAYFIKLTTVLEQEIRVYKHVMQKKPNSFNECRTAINNYSIEQL